MAASFDCQHSYARVLGRAEVSNRLLLGSKSALIGTTVGIQSPNHAPRRYASEDAAGGQTGVPIGPFLQTPIMLEGRKGSGFPLRRE